ncbi:MAG: hypothetical protein HPY59_19530 [Anaerolineae bacterium]|nr:hypothetical protein [Anaerolineae bacterium]
MNPQSTYKTYLGIFFQTLGAMLAFVVSLILGNMISPLSSAIREAGKSASGFLPTGLAFLFNAFTNAVILVWAARRSSYRGLVLTGQLFIFSFGAQVFMTQIETGYFISAFPLLANNFQLYNLVLRGLLTSFFFSLLVTLLCGGFSRRPRSQTAFTVDNDRAVKHGAWLPMVYLALYMLFGYFVAWQVQELRLFYGGPADLNGFFEQWSASLMGKPELPAFQYFRGVLWMLCLVPLFKGFSGKRIELVLLSGLALALLPTAQLAFANPLMPAAVSLGHFWEVSISTGIFGALCGWFVPQAVEGSR